MADFEPGERVAVQCDVQPGAFPGEFLVTVDTLAGPISGFVREGDLVEHKSLRGKVMKVSAGALAVWLYGSFFTTNGLADLPADKVHREAAVPA